MFCVTLGAFLAVLAKTGIDSSRQSHKRCEILRCAKSKKREKTTCNRYVLCHMILIIFFVKEEKLFWSEFGFTFDKLVDVMLAKLLSQWQARSKHKTTGGSEHVNSRLGFGPSVKAYSLVHVRSLHLSTIPFVLVSNFLFVLTLTKQRTCLGYRSRKICQTIAFGFLSPRRSHQLRLQGSEHLFCPCEHATS